MRPSTRSLVAASLFAGLLAPGALLAQDAPAAPANVHAKMHAKVHAKAHAADAPAATAVANPDPEYEAIRAALGHYLEGHRTGDGAHFRAAFHPEAKLFWIRDGQFSQRTSAEYIAGAKGAPAPDEAQRRRRIVSIDRTGTAAIAKIELDYPQATLTDYMALLKVDGEWRIVNKVFHSEGKPRS